MQALSLDGAEVDYCCFCGGAWLDRGEIEAIIAHPLPITPSGRESQRACPRCETNMAGANLGTLAIERCISCEGLYFDAEELDEAAKHPVGLGAQAVMSTKALTGTCAGCLGTFRLNELMATARGLGCRNCVATLDYARVSPTYTGGTSGASSFEGLGRSSPGQELGGFASILMRVLGL